MSVHHTRNVNILHNALIKYFFNFEKEATRERNEAQGEGGSLDGKVDSGAGSGNIVLGGSAF